MSSSRSETPRAPTPKNSRPIAFPTPRHFPEGLRRQGTGHIRYKSQTPAVPESRVARHIRRYILVEQRRSQSIAQQDVHEVQWQGFPAWYGEEHRGTEPLSVPEGI